MTSIEVLSVNIHPSYQYLLCCTTEGFQSYHLRPFKGIITRTILGGIRFGAIQTSQEISESNVTKTSANQTISNYLLCGTGKNPRFPTNRIVVWNDTTNQVETEISINTAIRNLKLADNKSLAILCTRKLFIYELPSINLITTVDIPYYRISYQVIEKNPYICYQPLQLGVLTTEIYSQIPHRKHRFTTRSSELQQIAISETGQYITTTSTQGIVIKLFNSVNGELLQEFRRGLLAKSVSFLGFSSKDKWLICGTVDGSVHFFSTNQSVTDYTSGWGLLRPKSKFCLRINYSIDRVFVDDNNSFIYIISGNKFYSGSFTHDECVIKTSQLLVHKQDPFSLSPKLRKQIKISD